MFDTSEHEYDKYCVLVEKYSKLLHPNHYQLLLCKRYLAGAIRGSLTLEMVERRLSIMMNFISVFQKVDPGLTKWRGKMLYQASFVSRRVSPLWPHRHNKERDPPKRSKIGFIRSKIGPIRSKKVPSRGVFFHENSSTKSNF